MKLSKLLLVVLALSIAPRWSGAQTNLCYNFENNIWPTGWVALFSANAGNANIYSGKLRVVTSHGDTYVVLPDLGIDFSNGIAVQFYAKGYGVVEVGTMPNMEDWDNFIPMSNLPYYGNNWHRHIVELTTIDPYQRHICFHFKQSGGAYYIDNIFITTNNGLVGNFRIMNSTRELASNNDNSWVWNIYNGLCNNDTVHLAWDTYAGHQFTLTVVNNNSYNTIYSNPNQTGNSLDLYLPPGSYTISWTNFSGASNTCTMSYMESVTLNITDIPCDSTPCVNITSLFSNKCTPYYGTFSNPYQHLGYITTANNYTSRHLICNNTMTDPVVGMQLPVVPPGETHSVRLGNRQTGSEAEAMVYDIVVDTTDFDMLILKYAAVMQDPNHDSASQPRFRIEMLDENGNLIAPAACNSYDFVSSPTLGWNTLYYDHSTVLWKDWTIVGINLSGYHGQSVRLRLTTYDCAHGAHFGYAYYTLSCAKKTLSFSSCSEGGSNLVSAPEGFNYRWYRDDNSATISTERSTRIPADGHYYYCDMSFIGDPTCSVTMNIFSRLVYPEAEFSYTVARDNCRFRVDFSDHSHHVGDSATTCEQVRWDFGERGVSSLRHPTVYYPDTGTYSVMLVASIPGGNCHDTAFATLHLKLDSDTIDTTFCVNRTLTFRDSTYSTAGNHIVLPNCDSLVLLRLTALDTTLTDTTAVACNHLTYRNSTFYTDTVCDFTYTNAAGCDSTFRLHLTLLPEHQTTDSITVCPGRPWRFMENGLTPPCSFDTLFHNTFGCDSLVHVVLTPRGDGYRLLPLYRLDSSAWHPADTVIFGCAPDTLHLRDTTPGSVAWLWTLAANGDTITSTASETMLPLPTYTMDGSYRLVAVSDAGCYDTLQYPVYIFRSPMAEFDWQYPGGPGIKPPIERPEVQFINLSSPLDSLTYLWHIPTQPGSTEYDTSTEINPFYHWGQPGDYMQGGYDVQLVAYWTQLYLLQPLGDSITHTCTDTATHRVSITNDYLQFPNLVTPNGDSINDIWRVVNLLEFGNYPINELWVYNQWGAEVYHVRNICRESDFWDPNATESPDGTYFYRFLAQGPYGVVKRNGLIEVLR